jgi:hypothetical protein
MNLFIFAICWTILVFLGGILCGWVLKQRELDGRYEEEPRGSRTTFDDA